MWLIPGGYAFALQAGSICNDAFAAVYALAAIDFALRAERSRRFKNLLLSLLALALTTGAKATNLPLGLPWLIAAFPILLYWVRRQPVKLLAAGIVAAFASYLPMAALNQFHCGDWTGVSLEEQGEIPVSIDDLPSG